MAEWRLCVQSPRALIRIAIVLEVSSELDELLKGCHSRSEIPGILMYKKLNALYSNPAHHGPDSSFSQKLIHDPSASRF